MTNRKNLLLFKHIPYIVRREEQGHFSIEEVEKFLLDAFSKSSIGQKDIVSVFLDNKYNNQNILVETYKGIKSEMETVTITWGDFTDGDNEALWVNINYQESNILPQINIIKQTCNDLQISQNDLAYLLGVKEQSLRNMISKNNFSTQIERSIDLLMENNKLHIQLKDCISFKKELKKFIQ